MSGSRPKTGLTATHRRPWRHPYVRHLRLPFNVLLSPIYLYGLLSASHVTRAGAGGSTPLVDAILAWLSLHVFLYGGATAFNSFYDRDEGPVGGMFEPPAVDARLLPFSLAVQGVGLLVALLVNASFAVAWCLLFMLFVGYSHPSVRLKARPAPALVGIGVGQGALGFALGWLVGASPSSLVSLRPVVGMLATAFVVAGLYVVTQSYQTAEDDRRGDRTLPVLVGPGNALLWATAALAVGGAVLVFDLHRWAGAPVSIPLALSFAAVGLFLLHWARTFDAEDVRGNYGRAMAVAATAGIGLTIALLASGAAWHV